jgi:hypothetical protein
VPKPVQEVICKNVVKPNLNGDTLKLALKLRRDFELFQKSLDNNVLAKLSGKSKSEDKPSFLFVERSLINYFEMK